MKVRWGVLSTARIGTYKVIPAMQAGQYSEVTGIASRKLDKALEAAKRLGIPKPYGSYEELLADPDIDAVYIPLPNHLHVPWSIRALQAGKHVLCEKPIGLSSEEAKELLQAARKRPELEVMEAFMYRHHPQYQKIRQLVEEGEIGDLRTIQSFFTYHNVNPNDIRNQAGIGGGGLMDIGCYCISLSRLLFDAEPQKVFGIVEYDPLFGVDRLTSGILDFGSGTATFTCSTQLAPYQRAFILGTGGRIEIEIPFTPSPNEPCRLWLQQGNVIEEIVLEGYNQYTIQGDLFSRAVLDDTEVPTPLEDAVANMRVIEGVIQSGARGAWIRVNGD